MRLTGTEWEMLVQAAEEAAARGEFPVLLARLLGEANFNGEVEIVDASADSRRKS